MEKKIITITDRLGKPRKITLEESHSTSCECCSVWKLEKKGYCGSLPCPDRLSACKSLLNWCINLNPIYGSSYIPKNLPQEYPELFLKYRRPWKKK